MIIHNLKLERSLMAALFFALVFVLAGCDKEPQNLGANLIPEENLIVVGSEDGLIVDAFTIRQEPLRMSTTNNISAGSLQTTDFGTTTAEGFVQLRLPSNNLDFLDDALIKIDTVLSSEIILDSVVFEMKVGSFIGTQVGENLSIERIDNFKGFSDAGNLSTGALTTIDQNLVLNTGQTPNFRNVDSVFTTRLIPDFGNLLLDASPSDLANNEVFTDFLRGIKISLTGGNGIQQFQPNSEESSISIYFSVQVEGRNTNDDGALIPFSGVFPAKTVFPFGQNARKFTNVVFNREATPLANIESELLAGDEWLYVQSGGGTRLQFVFPNLNELVENKPVIVNRALLSLPIRNTPMDTLERGALNAPSLIRPEGFYSASTDSDGESSYSIDVTLFVQELVNSNETSDTLDVFIDFNYNQSTFGSAIIYGPSNNEGRKTQLEVLYTY